MTILEGSRELTCDEPGCSALERIPTSLVGEPEHRTLKWLEGRAWHTCEGRNLCPDHW
ncbi:MAG TPA: hypothetical protein VMU09_12695 [Acidimicrobiales bacterium]|nr:hypothetical protein [Acidimicrobiales bacterium]